MPSSVGTMCTRAPRERWPSQKYITEGKFMSLYTTLLRLPLKSKQLAITAWQLVTFRCVLTVPGAAFISTPMASPTSTAIIHHFSSHARTPRPAQSSQYKCTESYTPRGMAPSELLIIYVVCLRIGNSSRKRSSSSVIEEQFCLNFIKFAHGSVDCEKEGGLK